MTKKNLIKFPNFAKNLLIIFILSATSCSSLTRLEILKTHKTEAISVLELKIMYDGVEEKNNSGLFGECHLIFSDKNGRVKSSNRDDYSFYIIKTKPGIIKIDALKCSNWTWYYKNRYLDLGGLEFVAKNDNLNYLGNLVINYEPRGFGFLDIFGLGGTIKDYKGAYDIKVYDNIERSINFLKEHYYELKHKNVLRSVIKQQKNGKAKLKDLQNHEDLKNTTTDNYFKEIVNKPKNDQDKNLTTQTINIVESINQSDTPINQNPKTNDFNPYKPQQENNILNSDTPSIPTASTPQLTSPSQNLNSLPSNPKSFQNTSNPTQSDQNINPSPSKSDTLVRIPPNENSDEQFNQNSTNNGKKIGRIIKRNQLLKMNNKTQLPPSSDQSNKPQINEAEKNYRFRPAEVQ